MSTLSIREEDLVNNPTPRVAICLVLDTSGSMDGEPVEELNEGVRLFYEAILSDEIAQHSAEVAVVTFGDTVDVHLDFEDIHNQEIPQFEAGGQTPMGEAVITALSLLNRRKGEYSRAGVDYYQPWLVLMTDGQPTDSEKIPEAARQTTALAQNRKLTIFPIGIGSAADMDTLRKFSPNRPPIRLKGLQFKDFFEWLSKSVSAVSQSTVGESVKLDLDAIKSWGEI